MNETKKSSGKLAKLMKVTGVIGVLLLVAHIAWVNSGSSEWEPVSDKDGIRVWSMKVPGEKLKKYKVEMRVTSDISDIVFYLSDLDTGYDAGGVELKRIDKVTDDPAFLVYDTYKLDMKIFGMLDVVIVNHYEQDPKTGVVRENVHAAANKIPLDPEIPRIKHLSNNFTFTPVPEGGTDLVLLSEMDLGIPYVLQNLMMPTVSHDEISKMREILKRDRYRQGKPAFIFDPPVMGVATATDAPAATATASDAPAATATATDTPAATATATATDAPAATAADAN
jgi:hypothetical protein